MLLRFVGTFFPRFCQKTKGHNSRAIIVAGEITGGAVSEREKSAPKVQYLLMAAAGKHMISSVCVTDTNDLVLYHRIPFCISPHPGSVTGSSVPTDKK